MRVSEVKRAFSIFRLDLKKAVCVFLLFIPLKIYAGVLVDVNNAGMSGFNILLICLVIILAVIVIYKDRKIYDARSRAHNSDQRFRKLYDTGLVGLLFANLDGKIVHANKAFLNI